MAELPKNLSPKRLLTLLKAEKDSNSALSLFYSASRHPGYTHTATVFHHILRRLADPKFVPHVTRIVELIQTQKCQCSEDVALTVLKTYSKNSMVDCALSVFQRMREIFGCEPGIRSYNSMLNAFVTSSHWNQAELFFKSFETVGMAPNLESFNILIKISCKKKQFDKAQDILDWMWGQGLIPDVFSYGTVINGLAKSGKLADAVRVFDDMFDRKVMPDVMCYNILIDGFFQKRRFCGS